MSDALTPEHLAQIRSREQHATRGPWTWDSGRVPILCGRGGDPGAYEYPVDVLCAEHHGECGCRSACTLELTVSPFDADFIAHARDDVRALIAEVDRLTAALAAGPAGVGTPMAKVREHYGELTESLAGPSIVPGNLAWFDAALATHDAELTERVLAAGRPTTPVCDPWNND